MGIDAELDRTNGASRGLASLAKRSEQEIPAVTKKITVKLTEQLLKRLEAGTDRPGVGKTDLERFLTRRRRSKGSFTRLSRVSQASLSVWTATSGSSPRRSRCTRAIT